MPCRIAGEVPYFGEDSNKLSQLNQDLESERNFACVLIHGKSGVGKSRFLYELQTACLRKGNRCYIFHGDNANNSVLDFIRQLLYAYYNISFVGQENCYARSFGKFGGQFQISKVYRIFKRLSKLQQRAGNQLVSRSKLACRRFEM